jgi:tyrosyl-tRNA synthetase
MGIPSDILDQAQQLSRGAEILPDGVQGLAARINECRQKSRPFRVKLGIDPTSTDLHLGHAVVFRKLRQFQEFGHHVILIIGGFTAQIGDPSGRNSTRPPLTLDQVMVNAKTYLDQVSAVLDISKIEVRNNADWLAPLDLNQLLKLAATVTTNQLLAKDAFGARVEKQIPVGFHELFYPLLQAYDSVAIESDIELGGTDQRFNILQGRELQPHYNQPPQLAMLLPLLEGIDGVQKMSKTYGNYIGLKESPDDMFGKCMKIPDTLIFKYFDLATVVPPPQVEKIKTEVDAGGNPKEAKDELAYRIVELYHGAEQARQAKENWNLVHAERQIPQDIQDHKLLEPTMIFKVMIESNLVSGSGEAKRLVQEGAVRLNNEQIKDPNFVVELKQVQNNGGAVLQVGRRKFVRLVP